MGAVLWDEPFTGRDCASSGETHAPVVEPVVSMSEGDVVCKLQREDHVLISVLAGVSTLPWKENVIYSVALNQHLNLLFTDVPFISVTELLSPNNPDK